MRRLGTPLFAILLFALSGFLFEAEAQNQLDRQQLRTQAEEAARAWQDAHDEAVAFARENDLPIRRVTEDGRILSLQRIVQGRPMYYVTYNRGGAVTSSVDEVWPGGEFGTSLTGASRTPGIWDGGEVRATHQEFGTRVSQEDNASGLSGHATHVAGTMVAAGERPDAKGMAYEASLDAYDFDNDYSEMSSAAAEGIRVSNHSYGQIIGWSYNVFGEDMWTWFGDPDISQTEDYQFGYYGEMAQDWDQLVRSAPRYLIVKSAGNDRLDGPESQPTEHFIFEDDGSRTTSETVRDLDGGPNGYESLGRRSTAKNILTVGAVEGIEGGYSDPSDVTMSSFSSWGPTDDGRIKPDIVAKGVSVFSAYSGSDSDYATLSGTSMSSPVVSGSVALLQEQYNSLYGEDPWASTLKALLIHTADEAGPEGPDYKFGWGLMNVERAASLIQKDDEFGEGAYVQERTLQEGDVITYRIENDGSTPVQASIAWTDPAGTPPSPQLDPSTKMLVNDLDVRVEGPSGTVHQPYVMAPGSPSQQASRGDNDRDNVEQVLVESPKKGIYTVRIRHEGSLTDGSQDVSLVVSGGVPESIVPPPQDFAALPADQAVSLSWEAPSTGAPASYDLYRATTSFTDTSAATRVGGARLEGGTVTYTDNGVTNGTTYHYRLVAIGSDQTRSVVSEEAVAIPPPLSKPSDFTATAEQGGEVKLTWASSSESELAGYNLYRSATSFTDTTNATRVNTARIDKSTTEYTDPGVSSAETYYYRLAAVDRVGDPGRASDEVEVTVPLPPPGDVTVTTEKVDDTKEEVQLSWAAPSAGQPDEYRIYRATSAFEDKKEGEVLSKISADSRTYSDADVEMGTTYHYRVAAIGRSATESDLSDGVSATPSNPIPPSPTSVVAEVSSDGKIRLQWSASDATDLQSYELYRQTSPVTLQPAESEPYETVTAGTTTFTDPDAEKGTTYYYRLTAVDKAGASSALSSEARAFLYPQNVTAQVSRSFEGAEAAGDYRLVALPGNIDVSMSDVTEGRPGVQWQAYRDNGEELEKHGGTETFAFQPGNGFWLTSTESWDVQRDVPTIGLRGDTVATIPVREGWNIISNPLGKSIEWGRVRTMNDGSISPIWGFNKTFEKRNVFKSAQEGIGYYFFNDDPDRDSINVPYPGGPITERPGEASKTGYDNLIEIRARVPGQDSVLSVVKVGRVQDGRRRTVLAPPSSFGAIRLRVRGKEAENDRSTYYKVDRRVGDGEGVTFPIRLDANVDGPIHITAEGLPVSSGKKAALLDPAHGQVFNLKSNSEVTLTPQSSVLKLELALGTAEYVEREKDKTIPEKISLTSYPNPVRQNGTVAYTLPERMPVTLSIYDVLGRKVATLVDRERDAGRYKVGLHTEGLSSGIYFGRLEANGNVFTRKIVIVR